MLEDFANLSMPWHTEQWRQISAYHSNPPHALLLMGTSGLGKSKFAHKLAQMILCPDGLNHTEQPCSSCRLIESDTNPDLLVVSSSSSNQILIENIHEVRDFLQMTSHLGKGKVVVISDADKMNSASANALLKVLEEPPAGKYLILTSSTRSGLLPTILSRCVKIKFLPPPLASIEKWLRQELQKKQELKNPATNDVDLVAELLQDKLLLELNGFSPLTILSMLQNGKAQLLRRLNNELDNSPNFTASKFTAYKELELIEILDLLVWRTDKQITEHFNQSSHTDAKALFALRSLLLSRRSMLLRKLNLNRELLLEEFSLAMPHISTS